MNRPPEYGIIHNWDGAPHGLSEYPQSMEQFLDKVYAPMIDTQVGAHFWCIGEHTARYQSDILEPLSNREYLNAHSYNFDENVFAMIERGEDPQAETITRGHELGKHVYVSVRMNDNHFNGAQPKDLLTMSHHVPRNSDHVPGVTQMRRDHPEWLLGDRAASDWFALSWNMAVPEVRKHRLEHVTEVCSRWDWDGVELDWQRHGFHLDKEMGFRLRYTITDLQRSIREMTNRLSEERGKPFYVAARVSGTLEMCKRIGYDIPVWVEEGLVDILIPSASSGTDPLIDISGFKKLTEGSDVAVYGCIYGSVAGSEDGPEGAKTKRELTIRGIASRHWHEGADGIYVFNYPSDGEERRDTTTTMGSPETLRNQDKIYAATVRFRRETGQWRGAAINDRIYAEVPVPLVDTISKDGPSIPLTVADDFSVAHPKSLTLRLKLTDWVKGDVVEVTWDGEPLPEPTHTYADVQRSHGYDTSSAIWQSYDLEPGRVGIGEHTVKVVLHERNPKLLIDIILTNVELVVRY